MQNHIDEHHDGSHKVSKTWTLAIRKYFNPLTQEWYPNFVRLVESLESFGMTTQEYVLKYGKEYLPNEYAANKCTTLGNARNEPQCLACGVDTYFDKSKRGFPAFCGFSCSTKWYAHNTNRIEKAMITMKGKMDKDPDFRLGPNQQKYWILKGHSEQEAKKLVKERQTTFTLEKLIAKYGKEEGELRWNDRQDRWMTSFMKTRTKNGTHTESKVATSLFKALSEDIPTLRYGKDEARVRCGTSQYRIDCTNTTNKQGVEFFGDYWHGNPKKYDADDICAKKLVSEIWKRDKSRLAALKKSGYDIKVVWENDFYKNPEKVIKECLNHLQR